MPGGAGANRGSHAKTVRGVRVVGLEILVVGKLEGLSQAQHYRVLKQLLKPLAGKDVARLASVTHGQLQVVGGSHDAPAGLAKPQPSGVQHGNQHGLGVAGRDIHNEAPYCTIFDGL